VEENVLVDQYDEEAVLLQISEDNRNNTDYAKDVANKRCGKYVA